MIIQSLLILNFTKQIQCLIYNFFFFHQTRMQSLQPDPKAQYRSVYGALKQIVATEGLLRPLRGLNITVLGAGPAHALYFACYEQIKYSLSDVIQNGGNSHIANGAYKSKHRCSATVRKLMRHKGSDFLFYFFYLPYRCGWKRRHCAP